MKKSVKMELERWSLQIENLTSTFEVLKLSCSGGDFEVISQHISERQMIPVISNESKYLYYHHKEPVE